VRYAGWWVIEDVEIMELRWSLKRAFGCGVVRGFRAMVSEIQMHAYLVFWSGKKICSSFASVCWPAR